MGTGVDKQHRRRLSCLLLPTRPRHQLENPKSTRKNISAPHLDYFRHFDGRLLLLLQLLLLLLLLLLPLLLLLLLLVLLLLLLLLQGHRHQNREISAETDNSILPALRTHRKPKLGEYTLIQKGLQLSTLSKVAGGRRKLSYTSRSDDGTTCAAH